MSAMPRLLLGLGFLLWGFCLGQALLGAAIGVAFEGLRLAGFRRQLGDAELRRSADLASLLSLVAVVYCIASIGMPGGLLRAIAWLPLTLLPLLLVARFGETDGLRLRHVFLSLRHSRSPVAEQPLPVAAPFFVLILVAAAAGSPSGTPAATLFLPAASVLAALALFARRRHPAPLWPWLLCTLLALALGALFSVGLGRLQTALEEAVVEWLSVADTTLERTTTRIGDLGRVKRSPSIVWRVRSEPPPELPLLLFEAAYARFAGQSWLAAGEPFAELGDGAGRGVQLDTAAAEHAGLRRRLRLEGLPRGEAPLLPLPATPLALGPAPGGTYQRSASGSLRLAPPPAYLALDVDYLAATAAAAPAPGPAYLSLPAAEGALLKRIAAGLAPAPATPRQKVEALRRYFADGFRYSLELGDGQRDLARFLEVGRAGHCEYYATATTLLLRALGIPARYAVGFSLQEYEPVSRSWVLRRRHAHAWAQAWIDGRWVDVDTTPGEWAGAEAEAAARPWQPLLDRLAWWWEEFQAWRLEGDARALRWSARALALLAGSMLAWRIWLRPRPRHAVTPAAATPTSVATPLAQVETELALRCGAHCRRAAGETPRRWLARLRADGCPGLPSGIDRLTELHLQYHFDTGADRAELLREMDALVSSTPRGALSGRSRRP